MGKKKTAVSEKAKITQKSPIAWGAYISVALAITTPFFYLNGKAFHDGYLGYFELESSMFPMDTSATFVTAVLAWLFAITGGLKGIMGFANKNILLILAMFVFVVFVVLVFGSINFLLKKYSSRLESWQLRINSGASGTTWFRELGRCAFYMFVPSYALFCLMLAFAIVVFSTLMPFVYVGQQRASEDLSSGFKKSPLVKFMNVDGALQAYRVMQCSPIFCALYAEGKVITVPLSAITLAVSDLAHKLDSGEKEADVVSD